MASKSFLTYFEFLIENQISLYTYGMVGGRASHVGYIN